MTIRWVARKQDGSIDNIWDQDLTRKGNFAKCTLEYIKIALEQGYSVEAENRTFTPETSIFTVTASYPNYEFMCVTL